MKWSYTAFIPVVPLWLNSQQLKWQYTTNIPVNCTSRSIAMTRFFLYININADYTTWKLWHFKSIAITRKKVMFVLHLWQLWQYCDLIIRPHNLINFLLLWKCRNNRTIRLICINCSGIIRNIHPTFFIPPINKESTKTIFTRKECKSMTMTMSMSYWEQCFL